MSISRANNTVLFSIVTVCYNNLNGVKSTFDSVLEQDDELFEWIVIDGNSTDGTKEYLEQVKLRRYLFISEEDDGIYDAMNKGIENCSGGYVIFMNSGDKFALSDTLRTLKTCIDSNDNPDFVYGDTLEEINSKLYYKTAHNHEWVRNGMFTHHQSMVYKRASIGELKYDLNYKIVSDYAFTCEFMRNTNTKKYLPVSLAIFEGGGLTSTTRIHWLGMIEQFNIARDVLKSSRISASIIFLKQLLKHTFIRVFPSLHKRLRYD